MEGIDLSENGYSLDLDEVKRIMNKIENGEIKVDLHEDFTLYLKAIKYMAEHNKTIKFDNTNPNFMNTDDWECVLGANIWK